MNDATVTGIVYKLPALNPDAGNAAVNLITSVGILCTGHGMTVGDSIRIERTKNYNGEYILQAGTNINMLVIAAGYVYEVFTGNEFIYEAVVGDMVAPVDFQYVSASDGDYVGKIPKDSPFLQDLEYVMCIKEVSGQEQVLAKIVSQAGFIGL